MLAHELAYNRSLKASQSPGILARLNAIEMLEEECSHH